MRQRTLPVLLVSVLLAAWTGDAWAMHDARLFELDADARDSSAPGADWASLFPRSGGEEIARVLVRDGSAPPRDSSYFTGGGSKDPLDVTEWRHTDGDVAPDKNEITNAFAVAYANKRDTGRNDPGALMLYFGLDRYANNGDAQVGFWFLRNAVGPRADGTFAGRHRRGDILVLSDFTQGGKVGAVRVYRWVGSGGSEGSLDLLATGGACSGGLTDDAVCAAVNKAGISLPWSYRSKSGSSTVPAGAFYEGGVNLTRLVGDAPCFSSYLAETRSSQSVDAQLKDLALGAFDTCPVSVAGGPAPPPPARAAPPSRAAPPAGPQLANSGPGGLAARLFVGIGLIVLGGSLRRRAGDEARSVRARTG